MISLGPFHYNASTSFRLRKSRRNAECNRPGMQNPGSQTRAENSASDFMRKMDAGLSERRMLEEFGQLSSDELAAVLLSRMQLENRPERGSQSGQPVN